eukprot:3781059-Prorocentrum_lima.AAC.1
MLLQSRGDAHASATPMHEVGIAIVVASGTPVPSRLEAGCTGTAAPTKAMVGPIASGAAKAAPPNPEEEET